MKFSIITPVFNGKEYISRAIQSVIYQKGDFDIEYIVMDGGSTDGTVFLLKEIEQYIKSSKFELKCKSLDFKWYSQKDEGMYDAINKGFEKCSGDIYAWINHDDRYEDGAFEKVAKIFSAFPEVKWLKGVTSYINQNEENINMGIINLYNQTLIQKAVYGTAGYYIQQDSVFWRSDLWKASGGLDTRFKSAGDFDLWCRFSKLTPLYVSNIYVSKFMKRENQKSKDVSKYNDEINSKYQLNEFNFDITRKLFKLRKAFKNNKYIVRMIDLILTNNTNYRFVEYSQMKIFNNYKYEKNIKIY